MRGTSQSALRGNPGFPKSRRPLNRSGSTVAFLRFLKPAFSPTYRALPAPSNEAALIFKVAQPG